MDKFFEVIVLFVIVVVLGVIPDLWVAALIQWVGQLTGIQYLADASFWQGFWLAFIGSSLVGGAVAFSATD